MPRWFWAKLRLSCDWFLLCLVLSLIHALVPQPTVQWQCWAGDWILPGRTYKQVKLCLDLVVWTCIFQQRMRAIWIMSHFYFHFVIFFKLSVIVYISKIIPQKSLKLRIVLLFWQGLVFMNLLKCGNMKEWKTGESWWSTFFSLKLSYPNILLNYWHEGLAQTVCPRYMQWQAPIGNWHLYSRWLPPLFVQSQHSETNSHEVCQ